MTTTIDWPAANQQALVRELERVRERLVRHLTQHGRGTTRSDSDMPGVPLPAVAGPEPGPRQDDAVLALETVVRTFHLSSFERDVLVLCAGMELDARFGEALATAIPNGSPGAPTFGLALAALADPHWSALTPQAPLRAWRLVELVGAGVTTATLRIDERILHFLAGMNELDERLLPLVSALEMPPVAALSAEGDRVAAAMSRHLSSVRTAPLVQLAGGDGEARLALARQAARRLEAASIRVRSTDLPSLAGERRVLARLLEREALLERAVVVVELDAVGEADASVVTAFAEDVSVPLIVIAAEPLRSLRGRGLSIELDRPAISERSAQWRDALGPDAATLNGAVERLAAQFDLGVESLRAVTADARVTGGHDGPPSETALWDAARRASRPRMDGLAERIEPAADWSDLVLPDRQHRVLRDVATHVRQRHRVYEEWGFAAKSKRGLGINALFVGPSGTGKTMAAEVLAAELLLDLYRIDLASVVSKYIGETEKNLKRLFDAAEGSGAVLLFDEADALFGKRSEVRDSHDRYANIEVSYLLQRIEAYRGLSILTSNMRPAIDPAFLRRIRFVIEFPFPDAEQRAAIWRGVFPARTPTQPLDYRRLAQLSVAGGHIRNIAIASAFLAAEQGDAVGMAHLAAAARTEYAKLERPLTDAELRGW